MLTKVSKNRISAADALEDPWFKMYNSKQNVEKPLCVNALT